MPQPNPSNVREMFRYHSPTPENVLRHQTINERTGELAEIYLANLPASPETTLAIRALQQARMWANCSLATNPEAPPQDGQ